MLEHLDPNQIEDETQRQQVIYLINLLEKCLSQIQELKAEVAALKDHIKRLNGEQPRPSFLFRAGSGSSPDTNTLSSTAEPN